MITNWHNVTGLEPIIHTRKGATSPYEVRFKIPEKKPHTDPGLFNTVFSLKKMPLYKGEKPDWMIHPVFKDKVDVVAIDVSENSDDLQILCINDSELDNDDREVVISDDVYIVGYPFNRDTGKNLPIWKRGSIASEPQVDAEGLPMMYVDTASRPGMSGSPVFAKRIGIHAPPGEDVTHPDTIIGEIRMFAGIYSGRLTENGEETMAQLGIVWKRAVIDEIIEGNLTDSIYYPGSSFPNQ